MHTDLSGKIPFSPLQQAGLSGERFSSKTLELIEISDAAVLHLHSLDVTDTIRLNLGKFGIDLPAKPNQSRGEEPAALCLRPGEWLLFSQKISAAELMQTIQPIICLSETALLDNSDGLAIFRLSGAGAPWLLSKLSGLDFLSASTVPGSNRVQHCARTRMTGIAVVVHYHQVVDAGSGFVFDLLLDRSLARYLWELLTESASHADELSSITAGPG